MVPPRSDPLLPTAGASIITSPMIIPMNRTYSLRAVALLFSVPALGGFLFGFDISTTSYAVVQLRAIVNSPTVIGVTVAASSIGAFLGSMRIFAVADRIGRRAELRYGAALYIVGAVSEVLAGFCLTTSTGLAMAVLISGRIIFGFGIACSMHGGPTYIAEMAPSQIRGLLVSLKEAVIVLGILVGYVVGFIFSRVEKGWMFAYGSSLSTSLIMLGLSFTIPDSYRWLLLQNREDDALKAVRFVVLDDFQALQELETTKQQANATAMEREASSENDELQDLAFPHEAPSLWHSRYRGPMVAGVGLVILQQITGQPSVLSYATPIFADAGLSDWSSILVAAFKLCATLVSASCVEKYGRKNLLYFGNGLMLLALSILALSFGSSSASSVKTVILLAMFSYIGGYQLSFGPISWLMISECFPLSVRGQAVAFSVQMNFLFNAIVQFTVPVLEREIGLNTMFGIFALLTAYSIYFVKVYVPETKGLTLEQIERQFSRRRRSRVSGDISSETVALLDNSEAYI